MGFQDKGSISLPFLRINWTRRGLFSLPRYTSHTWHAFGWSRNVRRDGTKQTNWDHPGPGYYRGHRH